VGVSIVKYDTNGDQKIKIIHVLSRLETGGLENGVVNICNNIDRNKFEPSICCLKGLGSMAERLKSDIKVFNLNLPEGKAPFRPLKLRNFFQQEKPDIVHAHAWGQSSYEGILGARLARVPVVINGEHGSFFLKKHQIFIQKHLSKLCNVTLSFSKSLKKQIIHNFRIDPNMITVIRNGVNVNLFNGNKYCINIITELKNKLNTKIGGLDSITIGCVGSLKPQKNQIMLLMALNIINKSGFGDVCNVIFIGDGPDRNLLQKYIDENDMNRQVLFLGTRNDLPELLSVVDILISTSISEHEGLSNVMLEAMSSCVPVIATRSIGSEELVIDGENGFIVEHDDVEDLANKIIYLNNNRDLLNVMSAKARAYILKEFPIDKMISEYEYLYIGLLNNRQ